MSGDSKILICMPGTGRDPEDLNPDAERLLSAFAASLGASFPAQPGETAATAGED